MCLKTPVSLIWLMSYKYLNESFDGSALHDWLSYLTYFIASVIYCLMRTLKKV